MRAGVHLGVRWMLHRQQRVLLFTLLCRDPMLGSHHSFSQEIKGAGSVHLLVPRRVPDHPLPSYSTDKILCFFKGPDGCTSLRQSSPCVFIVCSEANFSKLLSEERRHEGEVFKSLQNETDIIVSFYRHTLYHIWKLQEVSF